MLALALILSLVPVLALPASWQSGVTKPAVQFGEWRNDPVDLRTQFFGRRSWSHILVSARVQADWPQMAIGFPMLPESHRGQLRQCANGAFDDWMRRIRDAMLTAGRSGQYLRIGWEANRVGRSTFPWAAQGDGASWRGCFRRWVGILNPGVQNFKIVWNMANQGSFPHPIEQMYPGDDVVDIVASQFYDRCPPILNQFQFDARASLHDRWGNPAGPLSWLEWAKARGKKWALPEWGVSGSQTVCDRAGFDNPMFMRMLYGFLDSNKNDLEFETYFNASDSASGTHQIFPANFNPNAAAAYLELWGEP